MRFWTNHEDRTLREMLRRTEPMNQLLHMIPSRSLEACNKRALRLGLEKRRMDKDFRFETILVTLKKGDMTISEIAAELGRTPQAVRPFMGILHAQNKVHIADRVRLNTCASARTFLWSLGSGRDAPPVDKRTVVKDRRGDVPIQVVTQIRVDPLTAAFFGRRAA